MQTLTDCVARDGFTLEVGDVRQRDKHPRRQPQHPPLLLASLPSPYPQSAVSRTSSRRDAGMGHGSSPYLELNPYFAQLDVRNADARHGSVTQSWSPIGD
jgi:hypothetical protein